MELNSSKGAIGLIINGAQNSEFNNIYNWADLGMKITVDFNVDERKTYKRTSIFKSNVRKNTGALSYILRTI